MKIEVSHGELLDKISILEIKYKKLGDRDQRKNVVIELDLLTPCLKEVSLSLSSLEYQNLLTLNSELWDLEDKIRLKEKQQKFDSEFILYARQIYKLNDQRAILKKKINLDTRSVVVEEKSHTETLLKPAE